MAIRSRIRGITDPWEWRTGPRSQGSFLLEIPVGSHKWQCRSCGTLLAEIEEGGLTIRRGGLQATVTGDAHVSVVCYLPRCRTLNDHQLTADTSQGNERPKARRNS